MSAIPIQYVEEGHNHWWWRPGWRAGRHYYACHLTMEDQPELRKLVDVYQSALSRVTALDLIPPKWLHLTMQGIGFTDEISDRAISHILQGLREKLRKAGPPIATFQWPTIRAEAVYLLAQPPQPLQELRLAAYEAIASAFDSPECFHEPRPTLTEYQPHVSVAYINTDGTTRPITEALGTIDPAILEPVTATFRSASLLTFHRDHRMYEWTRSQSIPIGAA